MKNIIITPTFVDHFSYIKSYLKSFEKYAQGGNYLISFLIAKSEREQFQRIIKRYHKLPIDVLYFEDLLKEYGITTSPASLLKTHGKFSYQTLKKFYAMLHYGSEARFLVLDSESVLLNKTNIAEMFDNYFKDPFISVSHIKKRQRIHILFQYVFENTGQLGLSKDIWCLENFVWYYDSRILSDMFKELGSPIEIVNRISNYRKKHPVSGSLFEIQIYQCFIYKYYNKYRYRLVNIDEELKEALPENILQEYLTTFFHAKGGGCGLLEQTMDLLNKRNVKYLAKLFYKLKFNIIRCDNTRIKNYILQKKFLRIVQPNILASSQDHAFGTEGTFTYLLKTSRYGKKFSEVLRSIKGSLKKIWGFLCKVKEFIIKIWQKPIFDPLRLLLYLPLVLFNMLRITIILIRSTFIR